MSTSLPNYKLTIGELFPADDLVAQWVFTLNSLCEDLQILFEPLKVGPRSVAISAG